jgi:hypothetical protein
MEAVMKMYRITLKHDRGIIRIRTTSSSKQAAINKVCMAEGCPESAVIKIEAVSVRTRRFSRI